MSRISPHAKSRPFLPAAGFRRLRQRSLGQARPQRPVGTIQPQRFQFQRRARPRHRQAGRQGLREDHAARGTHRRQQLLQQSRYRANHRQRRAAGKVSPGGTRLGAVPAEQHPGARRVVRSGERRRVRIQRRRPRADPWQVGREAGPYLMLPVLGPSSVRDAFARAADTTSNPSGTSGTKARATSSVLSTCSTSAPACSSSTPSSSAATTATRSCAMPGCSVASTR